MPLSSVKLCTSKRIAARTAANSRQLHLALQRLSLHLFIFHFFHYAPYNWANRRARWLMVAPADAPALVSEWTYEWAASGLRGVKFISRFPYLGYLLQFVAVCLYWLRMMHLNPEICNSLCLNGPSCSFIEVLPYKRLWLVTFGFVLRLVCTIEDCGVYMFFWLLM